MKSVLDIVSEASGMQYRMPKYIKVQSPKDWKKTVTVETIPDVAWAHMYPFSYYDELNWQRRIPGESKHGKTLCHEEGNYIYFLLEQPSGKSWDLVGMYSMKEEMLYFDTQIRNFESWMGANFSVSMRELRPELPY